MPRKIRELIRDLEAAGFVNRGGKGDHRNFAHSEVAKPVTIVGKAGTDAKYYQEKAARLAIEESRQGLRQQDASRCITTRVVSGSVEWPGEVDLSYDTLYLGSQPK